MMVVVQLNKQKKGEESEEPLEHILMHTVRFSRTNPIHISEFALGRCGLRLRLASMTADGQQQLPYFCTLSKATLVQRCFVAESYSLNQVPSQKINLLSCFSTLIKGILLFHTV
jgi:hypothetical protein